MSTLMKRTVAAISVCVCVFGLCGKHCSSRSPQRGRKWACARGPVKPSLSSALAPLPLLSPPDVASVDLSHVI